MQLWVFFWILYLLGPLMAVAEHLTVGTLLAALPAWLRPIARTTYEWFGIWAPVVGGAMSAAYCLARLWGRRTREEIAAFSILIGIVLAISYFFLLLAGSLLDRLVSALR